MIPTVFAASKGLEIFYSEFIASTFVLKTVSSTCSIVRRKNICAIWTNTGGHNLEQGTSMGLIYQKIRWVCPSTPPIPFFPLST